MGWFCQDFFQEFSRRMRVLITSEQIITESVVQSCSVKNVFVEISQNSQENTWARVSFLIKQAGNFIKKETLAQVFSCEFCDISKNTFLHRATLVAASVIIKSSFPGFYWSLFGRLVSSF